MAVSVTYLLLLVCFASEVVLETSEYLLRLYIRVEGLHDLSQIVKEFCLDHSVLYNMMFAETCTL